MKYKIKNIVVIILLNIVFLIYTICANSRAEGAIDQQQQVRILLQQQLAIAQQKSQQLHFLQAQYQQLQIQAQQQQTLQQAIALPLQLLAHLNQALSPAIYLTQLQFDPDVIHCSGHATSVHAVTQFLQNLQTSHPLTISELHQLNHHDVTFTLKGQTPDDTQTTDPE